MLTSAQIQLLERFADDLGGIETDDDFWQCLRSMECAEQLHYLPGILNWDDYRTGPALKEILAHPLCDAGTALAIYWLNEPDFWKKAEAEDRIPTWGQESYALHKDIETRYVAGRFGEAKFKFDPRSRGYLPADPNRESPAQRAIPLQMKQPTAGVEVPPFEEVREAAKPKERLVSRLWKSLRRARRPEIDSDKIKATMIAISTRLGKQWEPGGYMTAAQLDGVGCLVLAFRASGQSYRLLLGKSRSVVLSGDDDREVAAFTDITEASILK